MTEDETFIRAIVDNPGDNTSRLVYADWLDDHDDPRGTYLRAECRWAKSGKREKALRSLAATLDPVWVARVSRPPVGICADKIAMGSRYDPAAPADLTAVEARLKVTFPPQFRALLLNWNGAYLAYGVPRQPAQFTYGISEVQRILQVLPGGEPLDDEDFDETEDDIWHLVSAAEAYLDPDRDWYGRSAAVLDNYIPFAEGGEGDFYLIGVRGKAVGKVAFFHDFTHNSGDQDHLGVVAPSLGALLASIIEEAPEWYRLAKNGDTKELLAWIAAGGDVNVRHPENLERPLSLAVSAENLSLVRELLARGAKVDRDIREWAGYHTSATGKKIRNTIEAAKPATPKKPAKKRKK